MDPSTITQAIQELEDYKNGLQFKAEKLQRYIAEYVRDYAQALFDGAIVSVDAITGLPYRAEVNVSVETNGHTSAIIAQGEEVAFIEFGAGVAFNGSVGSSPHPMGDTMGFTIGSYGKGKGKQQVWGYKVAGDLYLTRGTPAQMPLYNSLLMATSDLIDIARKIFET